MSPVKINVNTDPYSIEKHNADGLCSQKYCSDLPTEYFDIEINSVEILIPVCELHAKEIVRGIKL